MSLVMNIYNIVTKTEQSYDERISQLQAKVKELEEQTSGSGKTITADETGYFVSYADGYESELTMENASQLTDKDIQKVIGQPSKDAPNAIGKMFSDYSCRIAGIMENDKRITEGAWLRMTLSTTKTSMTFRWSLLSLVRTMRTKWSSCFPVTDLTKLLLSQECSLRSLSSTSIRALKFQEVRYVFRAIRRAFM